MIEDDGMIPVSYMVYVPSQNYTFFIRRLRMENNTHRWGIAFGEYWIDKEGKFRTCAYEEYTWDTPDDAYQFLKQYIQKFR